MATYEYPFGEPDNVKKAVDNNDTPQQEKFEKKTGKDSDSALGDVKKNQDAPAPQMAGEKSVNGSKAPSGFEQEAWDAAEIAWRNQNGGHGISKDAKEDQVKGFYKQIQDNNEKTRKWEGK